MVIDYHAKFTVKRTYEKAFMQFLHDIGTEPVVVIYCKYVRLNDRRADYIYEVYNEFCDNRDYLLDPTTFTYRVADRMWTGKAQELTISFDSFIKIVT